MCPKISLSKRESFFFVFNSLLSGRNMVIQTT